MQVGWAEIAILSQYLALLRAVNAANGQLLSIWRRRTTVLQVVTLIAGSKRRRLLIAGDDDKIFVTRSCQVTPKTTEQHLIVRIGKSVAYVTNNKRLRSTFCTLKLTTDRHEASHGLFATAELLVWFILCNWLLRSLSS